MNKNQEVGLENEENCHGDLPYLGGENQKQGDVLTDEKAYMVGGEAEHEMREFAELKPISTQKSNLKTERVKTKAEQFIYKYNLQDSKLSVRSLVKRFENLSDPSKAIK